MNAQSPAYRISVLEPAWGVITQMLEEERTSLLLKLEKQEISGVAYLQGCLGGLRIVGGMLDTLRILNSNPLEKEENSNPLEK